MHNFQNGTDIPGIQPPNLGLVEYADFVDEPHGHVVSNISPTVYQHEPVKLTIQHARPGGAPCFVWNSTSTFSIVVWLSNMAPTTSGHRFVNEANMMVSFDSKGAWEEGN